MWTKTSTKTLKPENYIYLLGLTSGIQLYSVFCTLFCKHECTMVFINIINSCISLSFLRHKLSEHIPGRGCRTD